MKPLHRWSCWLGSFLFLVALAIWAASAVPVLVVADSGSCAADPQNRQLDFWIGDWTVAAPGSSSHATSKVHLTLDQCLFVENWDGGRGHSGENLFAYSPDDKTWYGMFADNEGRVHIFTSGKVASGVAEFQGTSRDPKGATVLNKVTVARIDANRVEQTWQKSSDNGSTWTTAFRGEYTRAKP